MKEIEYLNQQKPLS